MGNYNELAKKIISTGATTITIDNTIQYKNRLRYWWSSDDILKLYPYIDTFVINNSTTTLSSTTTITSKIRFSLTAPVIVIDRDYNYEMFAKCLTRKHMICFLSDDIHKLTKNAVKIDANPFYGRYTKIYKPNW